MIDLHGLTVLRELMAMPETSIKDGVREMRTIAVIDGVHHFLNSKKRNQILKRLKFFHRKLIIWQPPALLVKIMTPKPTTLSIN